MAQHPVPAELMDAMERAMTDASEYADRQEATAGQLWGLRALAAEIVDRLAAEGWTLTRCEHRGASTPAGACRTCGENLLPAEYGDPPEHEHVHGADFRCIICAEDVSR